MSTRHVAVYCGSSPGDDPIYEKAAAELGEALAMAGHGVVYGGGRVGLMGVVADAALAAGGSVRGVITGDLLEREIAHDGLTQLDVVDSMHARKARMIEVSDSVITLPGGFGTLDETFEVLTWNQLGLTARTVVFLDLDGYFTDLLAFIAGGVDAGFIRGEHAELARRAMTVAEAVEMSAREPALYRPKWQ